MISRAAIETLCEFSQATFTLELHTKQPGVKELVDLGLIERHPGILGSYASYYRTSLGMKTWETLCLKVK